MNDMKIARRKGEPENQKPRNCFFDTLCQTGSSFLHSIEFFVVFPAMKKFTAANGTFLISPIIFLSLSAAPWKFMIIALFLNQSKRRHIVMLNAPSIFMANLNL